jgi:hypothetical protein
MAASVRVPPDAATAAGAGAHAIEFEVRRIDAGDAGREALTVEKSTFVVPR